MRKGIVLIGLCIFSQMAYADNIKFSMIGNNQNFAATTIIQSTIKVLTKENIDISENSPYLNGKIQLLQQDRPYLIVYLLNKHTFDVRTIRIDMDNQYNVVYPLQLNYQLTPQDMDQPSPRTKCPNQSIDFVIAAPLYNDLGNFTKNILDAEYKTAVTQGLKVTTLYGKYATVQNYKNWLSCPNLKAFTSIGHGNSNLLVLSDGGLVYDYFQNTVRLNKNTMVTINSCEVFNNPMKDAVIKSAQAQQYYGGKNTISIVGSTTTYGCMWDAVLKGENIRHAFVDCVVKHDPYVAGSTSPVYIDNFTKRTLVVRTNLRELQVTTRQLVDTIKLAPNEALKSISILEPGNIACTPVDTTLGLQASELYIQKVDGKCKIKTRKYNPKEGIEDLYGLEGQGSEYLRR